MSETERQGGMDAVDELYQKEVNNLFIYICILSKKLVFFLKKKKKTFEKNKIETIENDRTRLLGKTNDAVKRQRVNKVSLFWCGGETGAVYVEKLYFHVCVAVV